MSFLYRSDENEGFLLADAPANRRSEIFAIQSRLQNIDVAYVLKLSVNGWIARGEVTLKLLVCRSVAVSCRLQFIA